MTYIDENTKNVGLAKAPDVYPSVVPLSINPLTGELRVEVIPTGSDGTIISYENIPIDENTHQVAGAVTDDSNEDIVPLTVTDILGVNCLRIDIL